MRSLVTGGCGFIGSHLVDRLIREGWGVTILDRDESPVWRIPDGVGFIREEMNNRGALEEAVSQADVVFHLAWSGVHQSSNQDLRGHVEMNLLPSVDLFDLCARHRVRKVVFISSGGTVYGRAVRLPIAEDHPTVPLNGYGAAKLAAESFLRLQTELHQLPHVILRPSVPFGERQNPDGIQGAVAVFMGKALRGEPIVIWGDGSVVRDFFHVADLADAFVAAAASPVTAGTYNVGSGVGVSLDELVAALREVTGIPVEVRYEEGRPFDAPAVVMDVSAIGRDLGWRPRVGFAEGLERTWNWLKEEWRCGR